MHDIILSPEDHKPWKGFQLHALKELRPEILLYDFQYWGIYKALEQTRYILGLPCGSGKTLISIAAFLYYRILYPQTKLIIVTNSSALFQFEGEFQHFFSQYPKIQVVHQTAKEITASRYKKERKEIISLWGQPGSDFYETLILNYPILRIEKEALMSAITKLRMNAWGTFIILDEATAFKGLTTKTARAVTSIQHLCEKVLAMTATLTRGRLEEIYAIFKGIGVQICPTKADFERRYCSVWQHPKIWYIKKITGYHNIDEFKQLIDPYTLLLKKTDISASLPTFQIQKKYLEHSEEQLNLIKDIYSGILNFSTEPLDFSTLGLEDSNAKILQQLNEQGYIKRTLQTPEIVAPDRFQERSPKTEEILRLLEDEFVNEKIVIYTPSKKYLNVIKTSIRGNKDLPEEYRKVLEISGDIPMDKRYDDVNLFSRCPKHNIMLIDNAGAESLNLEAAQVLIITSMPDTAGQLIQLVGRLSRISSKHTSLLLIYLLHENSQDSDEYSIVMTQLMIYQRIHGESEKGLLDTSVLRKEHQQDLDEKTFMAQSTQRILLGRREKRVKEYANL